MSLKPTKKSDTGKPWARMARKENPYRQKKTVQKTFLIVCEGENTEVEYFSGFKRKGVQILTFHGKSLKGEGQKVGLVKWAVKLGKEPDFKGAELWCVFDYDVNPDEAHVQPADFDAAVAMGNVARNGVNIAWSNDCFELWFLLHYQNLKTALTRDAYYPLLKEHWGLESFSREAKTKAFCENLHSLLATKGGDVERAIKWASVQDEEWESAGEAYHKRCPGTTVYKLVEKLLENVDKGS